MSAKTMRRVNIGLEGTPGVAAIPNIALLAIAQLRPIADKVVVDENIGTFAQARHYLGALKAEGSLEVVANYQQAPWPLSMAMGNIAPTGGGIPYTWTWPWPDETAPTFATYTMEYTDGDHWVARALDVFATDLEISGEATKAWDIKDTLVGGEVTAPTSLTDPAAPVDCTITTVRMADTDLYIDDAYADLGLTPAEKLINFSWKLTNLQHQKQFAGSLYPNGRGNDKWEIGLELVLEVEDAVALAQRANLLTDATLSYIRLVATSGAYNSFTLDGCYFLNEVGVLDDRDGNNIVTMSYKGIKDCVNDYTGNVVVVNDLSALTDIGYWY